MTFDWAAIVAMVWGVIQKLFGFGGDSNVAERAAGEKLGKEETENAALKGYISTERSVADAGASVSDDPRSVRDDPDNLGPRRN